MQKVKHDFQVANQEISFGNVNNNNNLQQILFKIGTLTNYITFPPANSL